MIARIKGLIAAYCYRKAGRYTRAADWRAANYLPGSIGWEWGELLAARGGLWREIGRAFVEVR